VNAADLIAAIRSEHYDLDGLFCHRCSDGTGYPWPCPPAIAADRIEAVDTAANRWVASGKRSDLSAAFAALDGRTQ
jgi:hypothetical protein